MSLAACPWGTVAVQLDPLELLTEQKNWLGKAQLSGKYTNAFLACKYGLDSKVLYKYKYAVRDNIYLHENVGSPPLLTPDDKKCLKMEMLDSTYKWKPKDFQERALFYVEKRAEKRNICIQARCGDSNRSLARLGAELGTVSGNAEPTRATA